MNRLRVENSIADAYEILAHEKIKIAKDGKVDSAFRSQISGLGAAICTSHLLAAIAFFSEKGEAKVDRTKLLDAIYMLVQKAHPDAAEKNLFAYVKNRYAASESRPALQEEIQDYAIALKLAMNLYQLTGDTEDANGKSEAGV